MRGPLRCGPAALLLGCWVTDEELKGWRQPPGQEGDETLDSGGGADGAEGDSGGGEPPDAQVFVMGCLEERDGTCNPGEEPAHELRLSRSFEIDNTEVTQGFFESLMGYNPSAYTECGLDCPVDSVSWHEAAAFAEARSEEEGLEGCYRCTGSGSGVRCELRAEPYACGGWRLPTEAEWEYAARCGEEHRYAGSDDLYAVGWFSGNADGPQPVGGKLPNACGLVDMTGNAWEWVGDWYDIDYYEDSPAEDPTGPRSGEGRVFRGGSWSHSDTYARVASRGGIDPADQDRALGFRLVRSLP